MGRSLPLCVEREWYSLRDIQEVFRFSRKAITSILVDAQKQGMPVRVAVLDFSGHPMLSRQRPFVRVERRSLVRYLSAFCGMPEDTEVNSRWLEWISLTDIEQIYGFSRESLRKMLKDAEWKGSPIRTMKLTFKNGYQAANDSRCYRVERRSLNAYLERHMASLS